MRFWRWKGRRGLPPGVQFKESEENPSGRYEVYRTSTREAALAFLNGQIVRENRTYVIVETPQGNFGRDLLAIFDERTQEVIRSVPRDALPKPVRSDTHCHLCGYQLLLSDGAGQGVSVEEARKEGRGFSCGDCATLTCGHCAPQENPSPVCAECDAPLLLHRGPFLSSRQRAELLLLEGQETREFYIRGRGVASLRRSESCYREALKLLDAHSDLAPVAHDSLGNTLLDFYRSNGRLRSISAAIAEYRAALQVTTDRHPLRPVTLANLGGALAERAGLTASRSDFEEARRLVRESLELLADENEYRASTLEKLGDIYFGMYLRDGEIHSLVDATVVYQEVLRLPAPNSFTRPRTLDKLGQLHLHRYDHDRQIEDLDVAVRCFREALAATPSSAPDAPRWYYGLGIALRARFEATRDPAHLRVAIEHYNRAIEGSTGYPEEASFQATRADCLRLLGMTTGDSDLLDQAVKASRAAIRLLRVDDRRRPTALAILMRGLLAQNDAVEPEPSRAEEAANLYRQVCDPNREESPAIALDVAVEWGTRALERGNWSAAVQAFEAALDRLDTLVERQPLRRGKENWIAKAKQLPSLAACAHLHQGNAYGALIALERCRGRIMDEALERDRLDLHRLESAGHGDLARRFRAAARAVAAHEREAQGKPIWGPQVNAWGGVGPANEALRSTIEEIRTTTGFENFLRGRDHVSIERALARLLGPDGVADVIIYPVVTRFGGWGLLAKREGVEAVPLSLDAEGLAQLLAPADGTPGYLQGQLGSRLALRRSLRPVLDELGHAFWSPMLERLGTDRGNSSCSRAYLVPTHHAALLPLHAARSRGRPDHTVADDICLAYAPSVTVLDQCRQALMNRRAAAAKALVVGNPSQGGPTEETLEFSGVEAWAVSALLGDAGQPFVGERATGSAVIGALKSVAYIHLACHARFDPESPLASSFSLSGDDTLTMREVMSRGPLRCARLAVLSACQTAMVDFARLPDESVGLAGAFLQAGVPGVIGTLWPVDDVATALLLMRFYDEHLGTEGRSVRPVLALNKATKWLREASYAELSRTFTQHRLESESDADAWTAAGHALRTAAVKTPEERPFEHPWYWAGFTFHGV